MKEKKLNVVSLKVQKLLVLSSHGFLLI